MEGSLISLLTHQQLNKFPPDFLSDKELPNPVSLSENALKMLTIERKPSEFVHTELCLD